jgi:hypothetical protein
MRSTSIGSRDRALYATDNGRDLLATTFPCGSTASCRVDSTAGVRNGDRVPDPDEGAGHQAEIAASIPPAHGFGAHVAPLGITFYEPPRGRRRLSALLPRRRVRRPARFLDRRRRAAIRSWRCARPDGTVARSRSPLGS